MNESDEDFKKELRERKDTFNVKFRLPQFQMLTEESIKRYDIDF